MWGDHHESPHENNCYQAQLRIVLICVAPALFSWRDVTKKPLDSVWFFTGTTARQLVAWIAEVSVSVGIRIGIRVSVGIRIGIRVSVGIRIGIRVSVGIRIG